MTNDKRLQSMDETLRLLAKAPVPAGLEDRLRLRLAAPQPQVIRWPQRLLHDSWVRVAASVLLVAGATGGWWATHREPPVARVMPAHVNTPGSFANAGAMRTPETPVVLPASQTAPAPLPPVTPKKKHKPHAAK